MKPTRVALQQARGITPRRRRRSPSGKARKDSFLSLSRKQNGLRAQKRQFRLDGDDKQAFYDEQRIFSTFS